MTAATMLPNDLQRSNEYHYCRKHINKRLEDNIRGNPDIMQKVSLGVALLSNWLSGSYYESKQARLAQLNGLNLEDLVIDVFVQICYCQSPELFVSVTSQLGAKLGFDSRKAGITTVAEIVAVLCDTDAFDITKANDQASMMIQSLIPLDEKLMDSIARSLYTPPMVCAPLEVRSNYESPYLTFNDCQILGKGNGHTDDIGLDVINTQNAVALQLDIELLKHVEEMPKSDHEDLDNFKNWQQFKRESIEVYLMIAKQGNKFWLTNKVDKRLRLYAQGYHITSQGSAYKKSMIELHNEEIVNGVPT